MPRDPARSAHDRQALRAPEGAGRESEQDRAEALRRAGRRALFAAFLGFFVDMFDIYLPVVALAPAMAYFQPDSLSPTFKSTLYYVVFALSLLGRPCGATLFGHLSDKIGRRKVAIVSMTGFALVTLAIGLLPGYDQWGKASIVLLVVLRFVDGIFLGGEYTAANPLAMEYARKEQRGLWSACIHAGFPLSLAVMSALTLGLLSRIPSGSRHSAYVVWGWRIPFFLGSALAFVVLIYFVRRVAESPVWATSKKVKAPLLELFRGGNRRIFAQVFLLMSGIWFMLNAVTSILPGVLLTQRHASIVTVTYAQMIANLVLAASYVPFGLLGQRIGRRTVLWLFALAGATAGPVFYFVLVRSGYKNPAELIVLVTFVNLCAIPAWSNVTAYLNERFSTGVRACGYGVGYSAAIIVPAFSSVYMLGLNRLGIPYEYTQIVILAFGGVLMLVGALAGPETRDVDIA
jgi:MFS family permease